MTKQNIFIFALAVVVSVTISYVLAPSLSRFGATVENYPDWFTAGIQIGGTNSKIIVQANCATKAFSTGSLAANTSTSFDIALAGAGTSTANGTAVNQVYWVGNSTTSQAGTQLNVHAHPTSTLGFLNVFIQMPSSTLTYGGATTTWSVCYAQF